MSARIAAHRPRLEEALVRFDGLVEAGVSIHAPRAAAFAAMVKEAPDLAARHAALAARGADAHYERIDFGRHVAEALDRRRKRAERHLVAALTPRLRDLRVLTPEADNQILRAAMLLSPPVLKTLGADLPALSAKTGFAADEKVDIALIGPAPIYHFLSLSLDVEPDRSRAA